VFDYTHEQKTTIDGWSPHPGPQTEVLSRPEREVLYGGARGGGKTEAGMAWLLEPEYTENPAYEAVVVRKNTKDLSEWVRRFSRFSGISPTGSMAPQFKFPAGGTIETGHLKDKDAYEKYQGQEKHKILIEELTQIPEEKQYLELISCARCPSTPDLSSQVMCSANPGGRGHAWVKRRFVDTCLNKPFKSPKGNWRVFIPSTVDDNPTLLHDKEYIAYLDELPEPLRSAWRFGKWDIFVGQYFLNFGDHLKEEPFEIQPHRCKGRIYGSMDYGSGFSGISSFGYWLVDDGGIPHRLFTKRMQGLTASEQADELFDTIQSFHYTSGYMPHIVWYDNSMDNKARLEQERDFAPIDYFKKKFPKNVQWVTANKSRVQGWQIMMDFFGRGVDGLPKMYYWEGWNGSFEDTIPLLVSDDNHPEDVLKCDIDHEADECRYGLVGIKGLRSQAVRSPEDGAMKIRNAIWRAKKKLGSPVTGW